MGVESAATGAMAPETATTANSSATDGQRTQPPAGLNPQQRELYMAAVAAAAQDPPPPYLDWQNVRPSVAEIAAGAIALVLWQLVFGFGMFIPTVSMRNSLIATFMSDGTSTEVRSNTAGSTSPRNSAESVPTGSMMIGAPKDLTPLSSPRSNLSAFEITWFLAVTLVGFTISNLFFLCILSAFLGCMAFRWSTPFTSVDGKTRKPSNDEEAARQDVRRAYTLAILRGFLVYVLAIAGYLVVVPESSLAELTMGQYARLAGSLCGLAFLVGYEPRSVARLLGFVFAAPEKKPAPSYVSVGGPTNVVQGVTAENVTRV